MKPNNEKVEKAPDTPAPPKQPYSPPKLRVEGDIEKLTQNVGLGAPDGITGSLV